MKAFFSTRGIESNDINTLVKNIRNVGTSTSHMTEMIDANETSFKPTADDLHQIINNVNLPEDTKADARTLLDALVSIVPPSCDLLYRV